jgi:hypothetical protein
VTPNLIKANLKKKTPFQVTDRLHNAYIEDVHRLIDLLQQGLVLRLITIMVQEDESYSLIF